ncbi:MAG: hypothetical protein M3N18_05545 [Actinomycetota bacterium]|nr:hypothetical protein [Actinomycetota bacterium]
MTGLGQSEAMPKIARERVSWAVFVRGDALEMPVRRPLLRPRLRLQLSTGLGIHERERFLEEARRVAAEQIVLVQPPPLFGPSGLPEALEERVLYDGSRFRIYRRYFDPQGLAEELGGRFLFAGRWIATAAARACEALLSKLYSIAPKT